LKTRHNKIERRGVNHIANKFEDLDWIFREQPIADVGIDAIIELAEKSIPSGKFIALQIKSGNSHLVESNNSYTYYIKRVHYYYWINLNIPMLLVFFHKVGSKKKIFWKEIKPTNVMQTKSRWKIILSNNNLLNSSSKKQLNKILRLKGEKVRNIQITQSNDNLLNIAKVSASINFNGAIDLISIHINTFRNEIEKQIAIIRKVKIKFVSDESIATSIFLIKRTEYAVESFSVRVLNEINLFATFLSEIVSGYRYFEIVASELLSENEKRNLDVNVSDLDLLIPRLKNTLSGLAPISNFINRATHGFQNISSLIVLVKSLKKGLMVISDLSEELDLSIKMLELVRENSRKNGSI